MNNTEELLDFVINAHGGMKRWKELNEVNIHASIGGATWTYKGQPGILDDINYHALLHRQYANYYPFINEQQRSVFEPARVAIENKDGLLIEELINPRDSFSGEAGATKWSQLQLIYFASYAMWTYLTFPFNFSLPGIELAELEPWSENSETWRRLEVTFPDELETHNKKQVFYYGEDGLLRRHDYRAVVLGGVHAAHYVYNYRDFNGIMLPTKRRVYSLREDNTINPEPVFVAIDILEADFR